MSPLETIEASIYDYPKYYDLVFGADCAAELRFIKECRARFLRGRGDRLFEPACGTGRLIYRLSREGFQVGGIDLNPQAVEFCNARLRRGGFPESAEVADMSDFRTRRRWDLAFNTINSFRHLGSEAAAMGHLECMAEAVRAGGIYLLGLHLTPTAAEPSETESWSARRGHLAVNTHMWTRHRDRRRRLERFGIRFEVRTPTRQFQIEDELVLRSYTARQMEQLLARSGRWQIEEVFDFAYNIDSPIEIDGRCEDVVYVLRRVGGVARAGRV